MALKKQFPKNKSTCKVTFTLPAEAAPDAKSVKVVGDFNHWNVEDGIPMKLKNGEFSATVALEGNAEYQFRYLVNEEIWENDWAADKYVLSPLGVENSVVFTTKA